jgi:hypothetical protein
MRTFRRVESPILLDICEAFLSKDEVVDDGTERLKDRTTDDVVRIVKAQWKERGVTQGIKREEVYAAIIEARRRGFFRISAPPEHGLKDAVCNRFALEPGRLTIAATESPQPDHVAGAAAKKIVELIDELTPKKRRGRKQRRIRIGFGAGWTTRVVAHELALSLRTMRDLPPIGLHATSSGFAVDLAHTAPVTFFGFFEGVARDITELGMFGPPYIEDREYDETMGRIGVRESVKQSDTIDILVTSLAHAADPHSGLRRVARDMKLEKKLERRGWVGDVQHLPYSDSGPIVRFGHTPVTLFNLEGLVEFAQLPKKHVVLVSPPCTRCRRTRAGALVPLLTQKSLECWTHLVTDIPTSRDLLTS